MVSQFQTVGLVQCDLTPLPWKSKGSKKKKKKKKRKECKLVSLLGRRKGM